MSVIQDMYASHYVCMHVNQDVYASLTCRASSPNYADGIYAHTYIHTYIRIALVTQAPNTYIHTRIP
jgi:hypothetical protein